MEKIVIILASGQNNNRKNNIFIYITYDNKIRPEKGLAAMLTGYVVPQHL